MTGIRSLIQLSIAAGLLIFAVPRLEAGQGWTLPTIFAIVWIGMMLLIIAAHLHALMGVDEETKREMERVKRYKRFRTQQFIRRKVLQGRK